jgi:hypothetical protein
VVVVMLLFVDVQLVLHILNVVVEVVGAVPLAVENVLLAASNRNKILHLCMHVFLAFTSQY